MKFLIDENLSPELTKVFMSHGLNATHVNKMRSHAKHRILDDQIRRLTIRKGYIIVTKDDDFVKSYVNRKVPARLIYIFNIDKKELLLSIMNEIVPHLKKLLSVHDFIEINPSGVRFPLPN